MTSTIIIDRELIKQQHYVDQILSITLKNSGKATEHQLIRQQDGASAHTDRHMQRSFFRFFVEGMMVSQQPQSRLPSRLEMLRTV